MADKIHFTRAPTIKQIETSLKNGAGTFYMPKSAKERMSRKAREKINESSIEIIIERAVGRPINLPIEKLMEIIELHRDNRTYREIEKITGIPKSTVHYIIRYAQRQKLKKGNKVIYL